MQTKHEACNSLLGFQGTSRMRPSEAAPWEYLWNMDMVQPGQAQALGGRNVLVALPPELCCAWGSCLEPCLSLGWNWGLHPSLSQAQLPVTKDLFFPPRQYSFLVLGGVGGEQNISG